MIQNITAILIFCPLWISCWNVQVKSDNNDSEHISEVERYIDDESQAKRFSGTVVIAVQDSVIYSTAKGLSDRNWNIEVQSDHRFDIASINKSFIAALIILASDEGVLDLHKPVVNYLTQEQHQDLYNSGITLHHLLTHTSGLGDYQHIPKDLQTAGIEYLCSIKEIQEEQDIGSCMDIGRYSHLSFMTKNMMKKNGMYLSKKVN